MSSVRIEKRKYEYLFKDYKDATDATDESESKSKPEKRSRTNTHETSTTYSFTSCDVLCKETKKTKYVESVISSKEMHLSPTSSKFVFNETRTCTLKKDVSTMTKMSKTACGLSSFSSTTKTTTTATITTTKTTANPVSTWSLDRLPADILVMIVNRVMINERNILMSKWRHFTLLALTCKDMYRLMMKDAIFSQSFHYMRLMTMRISMRVTLVQDCMDRYDPRKCNLSPWKYMYGPVRIDHEIECDPLYLPKPKWVPDFEDTSKYVESCHLSGIPMGVPFHMCNNVEKSDHPEDHAMKIWSDSGISMCSLHQDLVKYTYDSNDGCIIKKHTLKESTPAWRQLCSRFILYVFQSNAHYVQDEYEEEKNRAFVYLMMPFHEYINDNKDALDHFMVNAIQSQNYYLVDTLVLNTKTMYPELYQNVLHSSHSDMNSNSRCHFPINKLCERCPIDWLAINVDENDQSEEEDEEEDISDEEEEEDDDTQEEDYDM